MKQVKHLNFGAVICFERTGRAGHVAIVEEIDATTPIEKIIHSFSNLT